MSAQPVGAILAAGGSSRFGRPKQLARWGETSLIRRAVQSLLASDVDAVHVIVGAYGAEVRAELDGLPVTVHDNTEWREGMASSIRCAVAAASDRAPALCLALADQPGVDGPALQRLIAAWRRRPEHPAAAAYADTLGVPAVFPRDYFPALSRLQGDRGAKSLLLSAGAAVTRVTLPEAALDIDRPQDLVS